MTTGNVTNKANAGFFTGAILGEEITDIELLPQEYTYQTKPKKKIPGAAESYLLTVVHLDFVATIRTKSGEHKKVLIEIQKTQKPTDLLRFRTYLGEQYKLGFHRDKGQEDRKNDAHCRYLYAGF